MKNTKKHSLVTGLAVALVSICLAGKANATLFELSGDMDELQALTNPINTGGGIGSIMGIYDDETMLLNYTITWQDLTSSVTNMHFHLGAVGVSGGVELAIPGPWLSPQVGTDILLSASQETNLLSGNWYVNVHTQNFGGGEIRGQVNTTAVVTEPATLALITLCLAGLGYSRKRKPAL